LWSLKIDNSIIKTNIMWEDNFVYLTLAINILKNFGVNYIEAWNYVDLVNQNGRFNLFNWINGSVLIDSTYNAWPASMLKMIQNTVYLRDSIFRNYRILFEIISLFKNLLKNSFYLKRNYAKFWASFMKF
jgi:hypothetical protein